ncbi:MAG: hypothetical protein LN566_07055 [Rickettsia endosymbiont of Stiretrus anchorago]|nr:hypothetical protein [Rickettsia endosymbiont of Stiretrus anchorago]
MEFNRSDAIISFFKAHEDQKFNAMQIAKWLVANYPEEARRKANSSKNKDILKAKTQEEKDKIIIEIYFREFDSKKLSAVRNKEPNIKCEGPPYLYYYTQTPDAYADKQPLTHYKIKTHKEDKITEERVCLMLSYFLKHKLNIYNMPINHNLSSNRLGTNGNAWLHPDWVGLEVLNQKWTLIIKECAKHSVGKQAKLWSFEVKTEITRSNLRESFFQALSNSSWAHFGYLVAADLIESKQNDTRHELEMLCARHDIGFILLDKKDPENSNILIPAKEKSEVDWNIANRLAEENKDFESYLNKFDTFYKKQSITDISWFDPELYFKKSKKNKPKTRKKK